MAETATVDSLIDSAVAPLLESSASTPDKPAASATSKSTADGKTAPAAASGTEAHPTTTSSTDRPTKQASADDGSQSASDELTPDEQKNGVPFARHEQAVKNAHARAEARVYTEDIGYTKEQYQQLKPIISFMWDDPKRFHQWFGTHLQALGLMEAPKSEPDNSPAVNGKRPQPDLRSEDGRGAYSAEAMDQILTQYRDELMGQVKEMLAPYDEMRRETVHGKIQSQAETHAKAAIAEAQTWEGFEELRPEIYKLMSSDKRVTLQSAYNRLLPDHLKKTRAKLESDARQKTLDEIKAKPGPDVSVRPSAASVGTRSPRGRESMDDKMDRALAAKGLM